MALRALLFSKDPGTNTLLTNVCQSEGVRVEICDDIFTAIEKGTKQSFAILFVDWSSQPEAGFLVKRARESGPNNQLAAIAIVDRDPSAAEMREHRLNFLIHRPVAEQEVRDMLASVLQKTSGSGATEADEPESTQRPAQGVVAANSAEANANEASGGDKKFSFEWSEDQPNEGESAAEPEAERAPNYGELLRKAFTVAVVMTAVVLLWSGRDLIIGFAKSPEGKTRVLRESLAAFFHLEQPDVMPVIGARPDNPQKASTSPSAPVDVSTAAGTQLQVVEDEPAIDDSHVQLRKAADFPLPTPQLDPAAPTPVNARHASIPDSIRGSASIAPPTVVTVNPAQMMPVSSPSTPAPSSQTFSEPVPVSEETARLLLLHSVNPDYPADAAAQKMHGTVVLQATIGRDGSVEDLKIVRGYFALGKAAIAAVKQWQFKPYSLSGHAVRTQTMITVNFDSPTN
jgi:TonB family protein